MSLGEQIIVMNKGEIIQQGPSEEIYNKPKNVFVGTFLGLPTMNIIECKYDTSSKIFKTNDKSFTINKDININNSNIRYLGIRPENIQINNKNINKHFIEAKILVIENLGNKYLFTVDSLNQNIKIISKNINNLNIGEDCYIKFDDEFIFYFDDKEVNIQQ